MSVARGSAGSAVLGNKLFMIGGHDGINRLSSGESYDFSTGLWSNIASLPITVRHGGCIAVNGKIYHIGGASGSQRQENYEYDPESNTWLTKASMPTARDSLKLAWFQNRIWAIGGWGGGPSTKVESYDPVSNAWQTEASLTVARIAPYQWVSN